MSEHYHRETRKARKPHQCQMCFRTIGPGEKYMRGSGMDGGTAWTWKECAHCEVVAQWVIKLYDLDEYGEDDIFNWDPETVGELRIKAHYLKHWTRNDGQLYPIPQRVTECRTFESGYEIEYLAGITPGGGE